jgi:hypothetical protein
MNIRIVSAFGMVAVRHHLPREILDAAHKKPGRPFDALDPPDVLPFIP